MPKIVGGVELHNASEAARLLDLSVATFYRRRESLIEAGLLEERPPYTESIYRYIITGRVPEQKEVG
jgi:hypothetical protein